MSQSPPPPAFPTSVYKSPGDHDGPAVDGRSTSYDCRAIKNPRELHEALRDGWCKTLPEAVGIVPKAPLEVLSPPPEESLRNAVGDAAYDAALAAGASEEEASRIALVAANATSKPKKPRPEAKPDPAPSPATPPAPASSLVATPEAEKQPDKVLEKPAEKAADEKPKKAEPEKKA